VLISVFLLAAAAARQSTARHLKRIEAMEEEEAADPADTAEV
jgi:hypothetical protein